MAAGETTDAPAPVLQGYVSHGVFGGMAMPAAVQNLTMRTYVAQKAKGLFKLSVDEFLLPDCHIQLYAMIRGIKAIDGIVMCSLFMLPEKASDRRWIYDRVIESGRSLHFIFETQVLKSAADIPRVEDVIRMNQALKTCPTALPPGSLPDLGVVDSFS